MFCDTINPGVQKRHREVGKVNEIEVVIYEVQVTDAGPNAWYKDKLNKRFLCTLDIYARPLGRGQVIAFKVMECYYPVKHILQHHCQVISQRIATNKEATELYGIKRD